MRFCSHCGIDFGGNDPRAWYDNWNPEDHDGPPRIKCGACKKTSPVDHKPAPKPDRLAELRAKYGDDLGKTFPAATCKICRCQRTSQRTFDMVADINELLDMVEAAGEKLDYPYKEINELNWTIWDLKRERKDLKAALEASEESRKGYRDVSEQYSRAYNLQREKRETLEAALEAKGKRLDKAYVALEAEEREVHELRLLAPDKYSPVPGVMLACRKIDGELWCRVTDFERLKDK